MRDAGERWSSIALAVGKKEGALRAWWARNASQFDLPPKPNNRKKITDGRVGLAIKKICHDNPYLPVRDYSARLQQELDTHSSIPSTTTIHNFLSSGGFKPRKLIKRPLLSAKNQALRLQFAREWIDKVGDLQRCTIWSDETSVRKISSGNQVLYRVHSSVPRSSLPGNYQVQQGGFTVMFWGFFSFHGLGPLVPLVGSQNQHTYLETVRQHLVPYMERFRDQQGMELRFMQDNASCHKAKTVMNFFSTSGISVLKWPPQSPDLNPIENLWAIVKKRRQKKYGVPRSKSDLIEQVLEIWASLPQDLLETLCLSMENRLRQCIQRGGKCVDY
jgi:transposase